MCKWYNIFIENNEEFKMFFVMYVYEGEYHLAIKKDFTSKEEAQAHADKVDPKYKAFVTQAIV